MTTENQELKPGRMADGKDIQIGAATVPYAPYDCKTADGYRSGPGWVLPGGERTTDELRALRVAGRMDKLMRGAA